MFDTSYTSVSTSGSLSYSYAQACGSAFSIPASAVPSSSSNLSLVSLSLDYVSLGGQAPAAIYLSLYSLQSLTASQVTGVLQAAGPTLIPATTTSGSAPYTVSVPLSGLTTYHGFSPYQLQVAPTSYFLCLQPQELSVYGTTSLNDIAQYAYNTYSNGAGTATENTATFNTTANVIADPYVGASRGTTPDIGLYMVASSVSSSSVQVQPGVLAYGGHLVSELGATAVPVDVTQSLLPASVSAPGQAYCSDPFSLSSQLQAVGGGSVYLSALSQTFVPSAVLTAAEGLLGLSLQLYALPSGVTVTSLQGVVANLTLLAYSARGAEPLLRYAQASSSTAPNVAVQVASSVQLTFTSALNASSPLSPSLSYVLCSTLTSSALLPFFVDSPTALTYTTSAYSFFIPALAPPSTILSTQLTPLSNSTTRGRSLQQFVTVSSCPPFTINCSLTSSAHITVPPTPATTLSPLPQQPRTHTITAHTHTAHSPQPTAHSAQPTAHRPQALQQQQQPSACEQHYHRTAAAAAAAPLTAAAAKAGGALHHAPTRLLSSLRMLAACVVALLDAVCVQSRSASVRLEECSTPRTPPCRRLDR